MHAMTSGTTSWAEWERTIASAHGTDEIERIEQNLFGRKHGAMTLALEELAALSPEERKRKGQELNFMKSKLTEQLMRKRTDLRRGSLASIAQSDRLDVTLDLPEHERGHLHLIPEFIRNVEEVFGRMGFDVSEGPEVETEELNFNLLNIPETHPARDAQDTFWIKAENSPINSDGNQKSETCFAHPHLPRPDPLHALPQAAVSSDLPRKGLPQGRRRDALSHVPSIRRSDGRH